MKKQTLFVSASMWLVFMLPIGCSMSGGGKNHSAPPGQSHHTKSRGSVAQGLGVSFRAGSDPRKRAFYEIRDDGKVWRIAAPVYHPSRSGVDGLKMEDYAEQKVYISPDGHYIAILENAGGEDVANLLLIRKGDIWTSKLIVPKPDLYTEGRLLPFSVITGVTNTHVMFGGCPVAFSELRAYKVQEIAPLTQVRGR